MRVATIFVRRCGSDCPYHWPGITENGSCKHPTQMDKGAHRKIQVYDFQGKKFPAFCELERMTRPDGSFLDEEEKSWKDAQTAAQS